MQNVKYGMFSVQFPPMDLNTQAAQFYEKAGLDFIAYSDQTCFTIPRSIWTPDIIPAAEFVDVDTALEPLVMMSQAAMVTEKIELGLMAMDVFRRAPPVIAHGILSLDQLSKGRTHFYLGAGEMKQFKSYGLPREKPFTHLEECMKIVLKLVESDGPVNYQGKIWNLENALMTLQPYENKPPKIGCVGGGKAMDFAGELGMGWGVFLPPCGDPEVFAAGVKRVKEAAERAGKDPDELVIQAAFMTLIESDEEAVQKATENLALRWDCAATLVSDTWSAAGLKNPLGDKWVYSRDLVPADWSREDALKIANAVDPEAVRKLRICGTSKDAAKQIQPYIEAGANYVWAANYSGLVSTGALSEGDTGVVSILETYNHLRDMNGQDQIAIPDM